MRDPVLIVWRRRSDVAIFSVEASASGTPKLIQQQDLQEDLEVLSSEEQLLAYLEQERVDRVAITVTLATSVLGWSV